ncbi:AMP-binding protein [Rhodococcus hoagii]|nr:AMP-binding protein [Prescottella equi]NKZ87444.1 AMP-binding protein [Prescottella equi]
MGTVWPLQAGAAIVVAPRDAHRDPLALARVIGDRAVTVAQFVPSVLEATIDHLDADAAMSLTRVFSGGDALTGALVSRLRRVAGASVHNLYGPTEATVQATRHEATGAETGVVPIGTPVWNTRAFVLDERLNPVPVGVPGELYLAGVQLARGYAARTDLTADRFVANPFSDSGERMYRTGDLVRRTRDGRLEYLGRTDFQVKLRGLRIELEEIETALLALPEITRAVVVVKDDQLVAYVVAGTHFDADTVKAALATSLASYMVPQLFVALDAFPINASGKLDRKALPEPEFETKAFRAPTTPTQEIVAGVFADVLDLDPGGTRRRLLRPGRQLARRDAGGVAPGCGSRHPGAGAGTVRGVDGGVPGGSRAGARRFRFPARADESRAAGTDSAVARTAAHVVPQPVRARVGREQHSARYPVVRWPGRRGPAPRRAGRDRAPRVAADRLPRRRRRRNAGRPAGGEGHDRARARSRARRRADRADRVAGHRRLRPGCRRPGARRAVPSRRRRTCPRDRRSPHRVRRLLDGSAGPRRDDRVRRALGRRGAGVGPARGAVRRLHAVAAGSPRQRGRFRVRHLAPGELLDRAARRPSEQLDLPSDRPRPVVASNHGASYRFSIGPELHAAIDAVARARGVTPFMVVHGALAVLLAG